MYTHAVYYIFLKSMYEYWWAFCSFVFSLAVMFFCSCVFLYDWPYNAVRGTPWAMMSCLKPNQKLTSPWLFVSALILESSQMLWKVGSRLFIQQRISPKHTHSISLHGYLSREAQVTVFLKSGRHKSPSAANYNSHPTCWSQRAGGAVFRR